MTQNHKPLKKGYLLVNFGSPESLKYSSIAKFLYKLLSDVRVVSLSRLIWYPILFLIILPFRPFLSRKGYQSIWLKNGSPLLVYQDSLMNKMRASGMDCLEYAMLYSRPSMETAWKNLKAKGVSDVVILPMYPQYSSATTASVFDNWSMIMQKEMFVPAMRFIQGYHDHPKYIEAITNSIKLHWKESKQKRFLIFSYHGIPQQKFDQGDPYYCFCHKTSRLVAESLKLDKSTYHMAFQSRFGKQVWLKPYLIELFKEKIKEGISQFDIICPGFSIDCVETLYEIGDEYQEEIHPLGGHINLIPCLNDSKQAIDLYKTLLIS